MNLRDGRILWKGGYKTVHLRGDEPFTTACRHGSCNEPITWREARKDGCDLCSFCRDVLRERLDEVPEVDA